jgi:hypothetical protein
MADDSMIIPKITKQSFSFPISAEEAFEMRAERFPRRHHTVKHRITAAQKVAYNSFAHRWTEMEAERERLLSEGVKNRWAESDGGYDWEPAKLRPLEPRVEYIYDETVEDHRKRVERIYKHHDETGEWLEKPSRTFSELINEYLARAWPVAKPTADKH